MEKQTFICIGCPLGCELTVELSGGSDKEINVSGHLCKIGVTYGQEEVTNPTRNIATSIRVTGGDIPMLSVKNVQPVPKGRIMEAVKAVQAITVKAPVKVGDLVLKNAAGTGIDFAATRDIIKETVKGELV